MKKIKKAAAGIVAGAAIAAAPLVAFAAPAFAATGDGGSGGPHNPHEQHVLVNHAWSGGQSDASHVLVNSSSSFSGYGQLNNSAHCGGGINC